MKSKLLINKNFALIWFGKLVSKTGDKFHSIALAWWILQKSESPLIMGIVLIASALPGFLFGPIAGVYVDIKNRKNIIVLTDTLRGALILILAYLEFFDSLQLWHIVSISIAISLLSSFFDPAINAMVPEFVDEEQLPKANALNQMINGISTIIGPIIGASVVGYIGFFGAFLINGVSFILSAFFELFISGKAPIKNQQEEIVKSMTSISIGIKEGFEFLLERKKILIIIFVIAVVHFAVGSFVVIMPFLAESISNGSVYNLGYLEGSLGFGMIIGSIVLNIKHIKNKKDQLLFIVVAFLGVLYFSIGGLKLLDINTLVFYLIVISLMGIAIANASTFWQLLLQTNTPKEMSGRVFSLASMMGNISMPIAYGIIGIVLEWIDFSTFLIILGGSFTLFGIILMVFYKKMSIERV
ncbi:MFS transporter [Abyssisolibacter fermentans]|uniref:MFS transporter n=1 Tax=Abyssisolibacter fermentans TaxID=1766203 RepID=UPI00082ED423|nr:MFS transporter [Abyssisolibacter fermentans]